MVLGGGHHVRFKPYYTCVLRFYHFRVTLHIPTFPQFPVASYVVTCTCVQLQITQM